MQQHPKEVKLSNFQLSPQLLKKFGYIINDGHRYGWATRLAKVAGVSPRTIDSWSHGERPCEGAAAVLIAYLAKMKLDGTFSELDIPTLMENVERALPRPSIDVSDQANRSRLKSLIKLHSSIQTVADQAGVDRPSLSRWLSGQETVAENHIIRVLDVLGLSNKEKKGNEPHAWFSSVSHTNIDEFLDNMSNALSLISQSGGLINYLGLLDNNCKIMKFTIYISSKGQQIHLQINLKGCPRNKAACLASIKKRLLNLNFSFADFIIDDTLNNKISDLAKLTEV
jgi:hypothetical protein